jgi:hypothetical protein
MSGRHRIMPASRREAPGDNTTAAQNGHQAPARTASMAMGTVEGAVSLERVMHF